MTTFKEGKTPDAGQWMVQRHQEAVENNVPMIYAMEGEDMVTNAWEKNAVPTREDLAATPVGLGDWDYRNLDGMGPKGEDLPDGAAGWLPDGTVDWGGTVGGWLRGAYHRITKPITNEDYSSPSFLTKQAAERIAENDPEALKKMGASEEGKKPGIGVMASRTVQEGVKGALELLNKPAEAAEQAYGGAALAGEAMGGLAGDMESIAESDMGEGYKRTFGAAEEQPEWVDQLQSALAILNPITVVANWGNIAKKRITGELSEEEFTRIGAENYMAAKMAYTAAADELVKDEFIRRAYAGEDPRLLALELQNPWAELVGQLVIDPLNALDLVGAGAIATTRLQKTEKIFGTSENVAKVIGGMDDIDNISDAMRAQGIADLLDAAMTDARKVVEKTDKMSHNAGLFSLTATGKRAVVQERGGLLLQTVINHADNPDHALDVVDGLIKIVSSDADEAAVGLSILADNRDAKILLSNAGYELGHVLRNGLTDADGAVNAGKFIDKLQAAQDGGIEAMLKLVNDTTGKVVDDMFPTVAERVDAITDAKNAMELGEELNPAQLKALDDSVGPILRGADKWARGIPGESFKALNKFFASVYMGMSPGYAFRNFLNNTLQVFVDSGVKAGAEAVIAGAENVATRVRLADGSFVGKKKDDVVKLLGGIVAPGMERSLTMSKGATPSGLLDKKVFTFASDLADDFEKSAGTVIFSNAVQDAMGKMLQEGRALPKLDDLVGAGMSRDAADTLIDLVKASKGDVDTGIKLFRDAQAAGAISIFDTAAWIDNTDANFLQRLGMLDDVTQNMRTLETTKDRLQYLDGLQKDLFDYLGKANNESTILSREIADKLFGEEMAARIEKGLRRGEIDKADQSLRSARVLLFQRTNDEYGDFLEVLKRSVGRIDERAAGAISDDVRPLREVLSSAFGKATDLREKTLRAVNTLDDMRSPDGQSLSRIWRTFFDEPMPADITKKTLRKKLWDSYFPGTNDFYREGREAFAEGVEALYGKYQGALPPGYDTQYLDKALEKARQSNILASQFDGAVFVDDIARSFSDGSKANFDSVVELGRRYGITTASDKGVPTKRLLNSINKYLPEGVDKFDDLTDVPFEVAQDALKKWGDEKGVTGVSLEDLADLVGVTPDAPRETGAAKLQFPWDDNLPPSMPRVLNEQREGIGRMFDRLRQQVQDGATATRNIAINPEVDALLDAWADTAKANVSQARLYSANVATQARDFALHDYRMKRGADLALSYVYPYNFWYSRTYKNWMGRLAMQPGVVAGYSKYRSFMEKIHAGMPDWWKYQINSNELLGLNSENPLYFNLEATLNPLNGLTGVDFNDPQKRVNWWTASLDSLNKFGPSTHTLYNYMAAIALYAQGQEDAAARWGGRLIPQTATVKSVSALLGLSDKGGWETDPAVHFFAGGTDPNERRRVGRALMSLEGKYSMAQILDAAERQKGEIWDEARQVATTERAWGQISSFFLGVGFKARSVNDMKIDQFYDEYFTLFNMKSNLSPDEFSQSMNQLKNKYPFMDAVLISRKGGIERDTAYAYSVIGRIPPGQSDDISELVGIDPRLLNEFYDNKGDFSNWPEQDYERFIAGIVDIASILDIPDTATKDAWNSARDAYKDMKKQAERAFGSDIHDLTEQYYGIDANERDAFLEQNPQVEEYLDWKSGYVVQNQTLAPYYGGIEGISRYLRGTMYDTVEKETGMSMNQIFEVKNEYDRLKKAGGSHKKYLKEHPELKVYWEAWEKYGAMIDQHTIDMATKLPDIAPAAVREDAPMESIGQQDLMQGMQQTKPMIEWQYIEGALPEDIIRSLVDGTGFESSQQMLFEMYADFFDMTPEELMDLIDTSMPR